MRPHLEHDLAGRLARLRAAEVSLDALTAAREVGVDVDDLDGLLVGFLVELRAAAGDLVALAAEVAGAPGRGVSVVGIAGLPSTLLAGRVAAVVLERWTARLVALLGVERVSDGGAL